LAITRSEGGNLIIRERMQHDAYRLIADLNEALGPHADDAASLERATGIPAALIGRILRRDEDPRIDHMMTLARSCGYAIMLSWRPPQWTMPQSTEFRPNGAQAMAEGDLTYLRDAFVAWRKTTGLTPTGMARICGVHEKVFLRIEKGDRLPRLGSVADHASHFGLSVGLFPERLVHSLRSENEARRRKLAPTLRRSIEERHRDPLPPPTTAADALSAAIIEQADRNDVSIRQIAAYAGIDLRTITGRGRSLDPTGLFATTLKIAAVLDMEIIAAPFAAASKIEEIARLHECIPMCTAPDDIDYSVRKQAEQIARRLEGICSDMARDGHPRCEIGAVRAHGRNLQTSHTKHLAERLEEIGFHLIAIPADAVSKALRVADQVRSSPRRSRRIGASEPTRERNNRLVTRFFRQIDERLKNAWPDDIPHHRPKLQNVLDLMAEANLALDVIDRESGQRVLRYSGREAGDLVGMIIDLRIARGYSLHALGAGVNLTHAAVRRAERPETRALTLLPSILRYAETIGLDLVPIRP
jgi:transcriptional regulator with XRE-family HTH domain